MNKMIPVMLGSIVALGAMFVMLGRNGARPSSTVAKNASNSSGQRQPGVMLFCAASNRAVMEKILADYAKEYGRQVEVQYGASQTLLSQLEVSHVGDLYLPADQSYLAMGKEKGLIAEVLPIARMQGVVAIKKGNPKSIRTFEDLLRDDVRLVQADPDAAAIGKVTREALTETGLWEALRQATTAFRTTVNEVANDVLVGAADAGIVYDAVKSSKRS